MNKKQRAALEALRDVMREHDISIESEDWGYYFQVLGKRISGSWTDISTHYVDITEILEQETEQ
jgi:hypothetical protein